MKLKIFVYTILLLMITTTAQSQEKGAYMRLPSVELPGELDRVLRDYEKAWKAGDAEALAALFTGDGFVSSRFGWIRGTDAIEGKYSNASGDLRLRAHAYATSDSVGYIVGAYGYGDSAAEMDRGKYVLALRRGENGSWLIAADLDNSNQPGQ